MATGQQQKPMAYCGSTTPEELIYQWSLKPRYGGTGGLGDQNSS